MLTTFALQGVVCPVAAARYLYTGATDGMGEADTYLCRRGRCVLWLLRSGGVTGEGMRGKRGKMDRLRWRRARQGRLQWCFYLLTQAMQDEETTHTCLFFIVETERARVVTIADAQGFFFHVLDLHLTACAAIFVSTLPSCPPPLSLQTPSGEPGVHSAPRQPSPAP